MTIFSVLLLLGLLIALVALKNYSNNTGKAWSRIFFTVFVLLFVAAVSIPSLTSKVAHAVGVGRGSDLIFYLTSVGVMFFAGATFLKFRSVENTLIDLTRQTALQHFDTDLSSK